MATVSLPPNGTAPPPPHLSRRETSISDVKKNLKFGLFHGNLQNCFPSHAAAAHCYEALSKLEASINLLRQHIEPHPAQFCFFPPEPAPASRQLPVRHTLPVFLRITPELNQSAWQTADSMLFGPDKGSDQSELNRQPGVTVRLSTTFWVPKVDGLRCSSHRGLGPHPDRLIRAKSVYFEQRVRTVAWAGPNLSAYTPQQQCPVARLLCRC